MKTKIFNEITRDWQNYASWQDIIDAVYPDPDESPLDEYGCVRTTVMNMRKDLREGYEINIIFNRGVELATPDNPTPYLTSMIADLPVVTAPPPVPEVLIRELSENMKYGCTIERLMVAMQYATRGNPYFQSKAVERRLVAQLCYARKYLKEGWTIKKNGHHGRYFLKPTKD